MTDLIKMSEVPNMMSMAEKLFVSGLLPATLKKPEQVFLIIQQGIELGIPPMAAINGISVIQGKPTIGANLMAGLIMGSGKGSFAVKERTEEKSVIEFTRGKTKTPFTFTMEDAKRAGLIGKDNWNKYPANMLYCRNLSNGARAVFGDVIMGLYLTEEINPDIPVDEHGDSKPVVDVTPTKTVVLPERAKQREAIKAKPIVQEALEIFGGEIIGGPTPEDDVPYPEEKVDDKPTAKKTKSKQAVPESSERPACSKCKSNKATIAGRDEYGGGWLCYKKLEGCGKKWFDEQRPDPKNVQTAEQAELVAEIRKVGNNLPDGVFIKVKKDLGFEMLDAKHMSIPQLETFFAYLVEAGMA